MRINRLHIIILLFALMLTGCYSHRSVGLLQERESLPQYEKAEYEPYRIQVNDAIMYRLFTMDETLSKMIGNNTTISTNEAFSYRVYADGAIDIPFVGAVKVAGLTLDSAQIEVQKAFREVIPDAEVKLALQNKSFTIIGDINSGTYPIYKERMSIFQALAMSGDLANTGDHARVRIVRPHGNDEPEVLEFDIRTNSIIDSKYYYIYPNDVIYVSRAKGSFYKVASYSGFVGFISSSLALLISVLNFTNL